MYGPPHDCNGKANGGSRRPGGNTHFKATCLYSRLLGHLPLAVDNWSPLEPICAFHKTFDFDDVQADVRHILEHHYAGFHDAALPAQSLKQTRHAQQRKILDLYGYRACDAKERAALMNKAGQIVRISAKP